MLSENQQAWTKRDETVDPLITSQPSASTTGARLVTEENQSTTIPQSNASPAGTANASPAGTGMNPTLARALIGGLVGATLGTLAGVLAGKRTSEGVNHAVKGVGDALKTVAGGLNQTAKGVGEAVKSVGEGVSHAVVGSTSDLVKGATENLKPAVEGALDAVKDTAENAKQSAVGVTDSVKDTAENAKQSTVNTLDAVKNTAEDAKQSENQSLVCSQERSVVSTNPATTSEISNRQYVEPQTADISAPMEKDRLIIDDQSMDIDPRTAAFNEGQVAGMERSGETTDSEVTFGA